ncbi:hypothetical protein OO013_16500 [Mangrovivirga sp. M17]|uniref:Uncharacterized protein n=1 Tax=Mangrovivirga halotolerans TaxID=2993936 RepID=A0ABT3RV69_9BACT|nr:hypothetical protein [Mangrovivirga halotolerans]MCX2745482.1 hypothetical protein [Mangrovivirga halotolerans]
MIWVIYTLLILIGILVIMMSWILIAPVFIIINTKQDQYSFNLKGLINADLEINDLDPIIHLNTLVGKFDIQPSKVKKKKTKDKKDTSRKLKVRKEKKGKSAAAIRKFAFQALKTFKLKYLRVNVDTDDYVRNAQLYPLVRLLNRSERTFEINFTGKNELELIINNRLIKIIPPAIKLLISK